MMFATNDDTANKKSDLFRKFKSYCGENGVDLSSRSILIVQSSVKSSLLTRLLRTGSKDDTFFSAKKIFFLYIIGTRQNYMEQKKLMSAMAKQTEKFGYDSYILSLPRSSFFANANLKSPEKKGSYYTSLNQSWDDTTEEDMESKLYNKLIFSTAINLNCDLILFNNLKTDSATTFLSNIVLGQTARKSLKSYYKEHTNLQFLFPMEIFSEYEIMTYSELFNYSESELSESSENQRQSVQDITAKFILKINRDVSPNISTIQKLCRKIVSNNWEIQPPILCSLCYSLIDTGVMPRQISSKLCCNFSMFLSVTGKEIATQIFLDKIYNEKTVFNFYPFSNRSVSQEHCQNRTDLLKASEDFYSNLCYLRCIVLQSILLC